MTDHESAIKAARALGGKTGWPAPALMQDDHRPLFRWLARKSDARRLVRESAARIRANQST